MHQSRVEQRKLIHISELKIINNSTRRVRTIPVFPVIAALTPSLIKIGAWTVGMTVSGVAIAAADAAIKDAYSTKNEQKLARKAIECTLNNVGCIENLCWTNCGPRLYTADWCFTTKTGKIDENYNSEIAKCKKDSDCDPCWPCGSVCTLEGGQIQIINGSIYAINK